MSKELTAENRDQVIVRTSVIGILTNILLAGFKAFIGVYPIPSLSSWMRSITSPTHYRPSLRSSAQNWQERNRMRNILSATAVSNI